MTPGKFIISASPITQGSLRRDLISVARKTAPEVSILVAGAQEGAIIKTLRGMPLADSAMKRMPLKPMTLAISWGSITTLVVPLGRTARANGGMVTMLDSI